MIGFFPDPYPDELLYSVCARFADRVQYRGKSSVMRELFGARNAVAVVDFPCRLGHLVEVLPSRHLYTVDRFIDDHTLLPFYSPFCPPQRIDQIREDMRGSNGSLLYGRLGILVNHADEMLRFCPNCVKSDIQQFGECYWHRVHQLPGVKVCPVHAVFLEESQAHIRHHGQLEISECRVTYNHQQRSRKPVGTFYCSCGFVYSRTGPDSTELDRFRIDKLKCYGSVWSAALTQFWLDESLSVPEIARRLGVSFDTVKRHAAKLKLPFPRPGSQLKPLSEAQKLQPFNTIEMASSTLEIYRQEWMFVRTNYPEASRKWLRQKFNRLYVWLEQYDEEWFEEHLPPCFCRVGIPPIQSTRVDWLSRDLQLAAAVRESAHRLLHTTGRPIWITRTTIGKDIGQRTLIQKEIHKLPLTASALAEVVETQPEYAIRRLEWATECFLQEKIYPQRWQLLQRASLKPYTVALPSVQRAIEAALVSLEPLRND